MKKYLSNPYIRAALLMVACFLLFNFSAYAANGNTTDYLSQFLNDFADILNQNVNRIGYVAMGVFFTIGSILIVVQGVKLNGGDPNAKDAMKTTAIVTIIVLVVCYVFMKVAGTILSAAKGAVS